MGKLKLHLSDYVKMGDGRIEVVAECSGATWLRTTDNPKDVTCAHCRARYLKRKPTPPESAGPRG